MCPRQGAGTVPNGVPAEASERQVGTPPHGQPAVVCPGNCPAMCSGDSGQAPEKPPLSEGSSAKPLEDVTSLVTLPEHHRGAALSVASWPGGSRVLVQQCVVRAGGGGHRGSPLRCPCLGLWSVLAALLHTGAGWG